MAGLQQRTVLGHPRGLFLLFATEAWERVQYYGMRAFLVLFLVDRVHGLGWSEGRALTLYGWYTGLSYLSTVAGGWVADRFLGQRRAVVIGGTLMMLGQFLCALKQEPLLYAGGTLLIVGNGLFKANISTMVGQLYRPGDPRRDSGFTIFYVGINLGAAVGPFLCGTLAEKVDWSLGFASAGLGMAVGVLVFLLLQGRLLAPEVGAPPKERPRISRGAGAREPLTREERDRIIVIFVLTFFVSIFWAGYEQGGGLMNLFTDRSTDRFLLGHEIPTTWFQSVNSGFIFLLAPLFASLWPRLAEVGKEPSTGRKMAYGLLALALSFVLLFLAARRAEAVGKAGMLWMVGAYFFQTVGELMLSPVGLSMVTKLAPTRYASALMGVWFLSNAAGNKLAGSIGALAEGHGDATVFLGIAVGSAAAGAFLFALGPLLHRMAHGAEDVLPNEPGALSGAAITS
ncbi:MAG TPA: peptide MFS transporter [Myxococcaceae bacterium]|nr:peptide MFS transporter [Myxococcaceae bacterium]